MKQAITSAPGGAIDNGDVSYGAPGRSYTDGEGDGRRIIGEAIGGTGRRPVGVQRVRASARIGVGVCHLGNCRASVGISCGRRCQRHSQRRRLGEGRRSEAMGTNLPFQVVA